MSRKFNPKVWILIRLLILLALVIIATRFLAGCKESSSDHAAKNVRTAVLEGKITGMMFHMAGEAGNYPRLFLLLDTKWGKKVIYVRSMNIFPSQALKLTLQGGETVEVTLIEGFEDDVHRLKIKNTWPFESQRILVVPSDKVVPLKEKKPKEKKMEGFPPPKGGL